MSGYFQVLLPSFLPLFVALFCPVFSLTPPYLSSSVPSCLLLSPLCPFLLWFPKIWTSMTQFLDRNASRHTHLIMHLMKPPVVLSPGMNSHSYKTSSRGGGRLSPLYTFLHGDADRTTPCGLHTLQVVIMSYVNFSWMSERHICSLWLVWEGPCLAEVQQQHSGWTQCCSAHSESAELPVSQAPVNEWTWVLKCEGAAPEVRVTESLTGKYWSDRSKLVGA